MTKSAWGDSDTEYFYSLTPDKILDAVESFGFCCTGRSLALNSMENRVYDVEIEVDEKKIKNKSERFRIVKFYRPGRWTKEQILEEHQFLTDLSEIDIPVVKPIALANGETLVKTPDSEIYCAVFPKIGGRNPNELDKEQLPIIGRLLARMHNAGAAKVAEHRIVLNADSYGYKNLDYLLESEILPAAIEDDYADVAEEICELSAPLFEEAEVQRVHGDCHLGNLLWGDDGPFWVDFDDTVSGPCVQDLWLIVGGRDKYAKQQLRQLLSAYEQMRPFDYKTLELIEPLRALRMIHFSAWIAKRWEDPAFPRTFVEFGTEHYWREQLSALEEQLGIMTTDAKIWS